MNSSQIASVIKFGLLPTTLHRMLSIEKGRLSRNENARVSCLVSILIEAIGAKFSVHRIGMNERRTASGVAPAGLLIICLFVLLGIIQLTLPNLWIPPRAARPQKYDISIAGSDWLVQLDSRGLASDQFLRIFGLIPSDKPGLVGLSWDQVVIPELGSRFGATPRGRLVLGQEGFQLSSVLFDVDSDGRTFGGPVRAQINSKLVVPKAKTVGLELLRSLPSNIDRLFLVDLDILSLPPELRTQLLKQWSRWEFDPLSDFLTALESPFCYLQWQGLTVLQSKLKSQAKLDRLLERRFPKSIIPTTFGISQGTTIYGFESESKPAWYSRGDYLVCATDGGVKGLSRFLSERFRKTSFRPRDVLLEQFQRLSKTEKGWHVCIIERSPDLPVHWALLLRWNSDLSGRADGYLVIQLQDDIKQK